MHVITPYLEVLIAPSCLSLELKHPQYKYMYRAPEYSYLNTLLRDHQRGNLGYLYAYSTTTATSVLYGDGD